MCSKLHPGSRNPDEETSTGAKPPGFVSTGQVHNCQFCLQHSCRRRLRGRYDFESCDVPLGQLDRVPGPVPRWSCIPPAIIGDRYLLRTRHRVVSPAGTPQDTGNGFRHWALPSNLRVDPLLQRSRHEPGSSGGVRSNERRRLQTVCFPKASANPSLLSLQTLCPQNGPSLPMVEQLRWTEHSPPLLPVQFLHFTRLHIYRNLRSASALRVSLHRKRRGLLRFGTGNVPWTMGGIEDVLEDCVVHTVHGSQYRSLCFRVVLLAYFPDCSQRNFGRAKAKLLREGKACEAWRAIRKSLQ